MPVITMRARSVWVSAWLLVGCGPPVGGDEDAEDESASAGWPDAGGTGVPAAPWMSGWYSSVQPTHDWSNATGFRDQGTWFRFGDDGEFHKVGFRGNSETSTQTLQWVPVTDTEARAYFSTEEEGAGGGWVRIHYTPRPDGCSTAEWATTDAAGNPGSQSTTLYPGKACYVEEELEPDADYRPTYHLTWCDEPPPDCFPDGCPCENPR
jgi:hypothetical protein